MVLAVGGILALALPTVLGWLPLWVAVFLHEGSTLLVALNSLRLLAFAAPPPRLRSSSDGGGQPVLQPGGVEAGLMPAPQQKLDGVPAAA